MENFVQKGCALDLVAPAAATSGVPFVVGPAAHKLVAVPQSSVSSGASVACVVEGVVELPKQAVDDFVAGEIAYWDDTNKRVEKSATGMIPMGVVVATTAASATLVKVKLSGQPGVVVP